MTRKELLEAAKKKVYWCEKTRMLRWSPGFDTRTPAHNEVRSQYLLVKGFHLSVYHVVWYLVTTQIVERSMALSRTHGDGGFQDWRVLSRRDSCMLGKDPAHRYQYRNWLGALKDSHGAK